MNSSEFIGSVQRSLATVKHTGEPFELRLPVYLVGNGGSAAIAAHVCNDIVKNIGAAFVPDYATLTCLANDGGWNRALEAWLFRVVQQRGTLIAISSSGRSENILNACAEAKLQGARVITLSGFNDDNPLRRLGHTNYWVPSHNYGVVECCHLAILHSLVNPG